jgi:AcrR family transcriptional regulator
MATAGVAGSAGEVTAEAVVGAARRAFLRGQPLDLQRLAQGLGIARATIYRWYGGRERILGEVLWSLAEDTLDAAVAAERRQGVDGLVSLLGRHMRASAAHPAMRRLLDAEPQMALRVLTGGDGVVQPRLVARVEALVREWCPESPGGDLDAADLAYTIVRVGEAFAYADVIAGRPVDTEKAAAAHRRLLAGR